MNITFEHIKEGNQWVTYVTTQYQGTTEKEWLCSFKDTQLQDGLYLCRQFAERHREHIEMNKHLIS